MVLKMSKIEVLDHGYATHIESWGSDEGIIEAARMSTNKGFNGWGPTAIEEKCKECDGVGTVGGASHAFRNACKPCEGIGYVKTGESKPGDEKLLRYLYVNKHSTPFEMAGLTVEIQAPILVFRQWHRHRTQSYNEMSARYTPLPNTNYMPTVDRCIVVHGSNKQARGSNQRTPTHEEVLAWLESLQASYDLSEQVYQAGLEIGIPKEVARCPVPVARYSRMRASANLRNWLAFLTLRMDSHAQEEIRVYADAVGAFIQESFPRTWELFVEGQNGK
jgi:thymidylate synthase (FAD)